MKRRILSLAAIAAALFVEGPSADAQTSPGGTNGQIQYNNAGSFGGDTVTTTGAAVWTFPATTISGHSAPTTGAILGVDGSAAGTYFYFTTRGSLMLGTVDTEGTYPNPTGNFDMGIGERAESSITTGTEDVCVGAGSGDWLTSGSYNVGFGDNTCAGIDTGSTTANGTIGDDTSIGFSAGASWNNSGGSSQGDNNVAVGFEANMFGTSATGETFVGLNSGRATSGAPNTGNFNTGIGSSTLTVITSGQNNWAGGAEALAALTTSSYNTATGYGSLDSLTTGSGMNTAYGVDTCANITTQTANVCVGYLSGYYEANGSTKNTGGSHLTLVGYETYPLGITDANETVIGNLTTGNGSNTVTIGNSSVTATYLEGTAIYDAALGATTGDALCWNTTNGAIGTDTSNCITSTLTQKHDIKPLDDADAVIRKLAKDAIYYRLNGREDLGEMPGFGAEWVRRDDRRYADPRGNGGPGVRYEQMVATAYVAISHLFDFSDWAHKSIGALEHHDGLQDQEITMLKAQLAKDELRIAQLEHSRSTAKTHRDRMARR